MYYVQIVYKIIPGYQSYLAIVKISIVEHKINEIKYQR